MAGSGFGEMFRVNTWGESHGEAVGVVIDGCPAGLSLWEEDIQKFLDRRKPGDSPYATKRQESDRAHILSGVFEGRTTGAPIMILIKNSDQRSADYAALSDVYRPGHADYCYDVKYGFRDYRGGGRPSGRETVGRVAAGAVAVRILGELGVSFRTFTKSIGPIEADTSRYDIEEIGRNPFCMPDAQAAKDAAKYIDECIAGGDSSGGVVECIIYGVPAGVGEPVFDKLDALLAKAILSIGAVKGFEIGSGFSAAKMCGSENNDPFIHLPGRIAKSSNHAGGTLGGISDGADIVFRAAVKPTPSISRIQRTVRSDGSPTEISIEGRHDPVIVPRAVVVIECMAAITLLDLMMRGCCSKMENLRGFYKKINL